MNLAKPPHQKYIFVCENERLDKQCCMPQGKLIREKLKQMVKERGYEQKIRVSRSGCLDLCSQGPSLLIMPDNSWYQNVDEFALEDVLLQALKDVK